MDILTVKENGIDSNTYKVTLLDGTVLNSVPKANGNKDYAMVQEWIANGGVVEPYETQAEIATREAKEKLEAIEGAVQALLDSEAKAKGYESILSACSYAGGANPFQAEGQAFVTWRGDVWAYCYQVLADVQAGTRVEPTLDELLLELPALV